MNGIPFSILVVEDDEDDRIIIDEAFLQIGYAAEVKKFVNGELMLRYLEKMEPSLYPSLIVLDNTLPKLNAADILVLLKKDPRYADIPVVVYTSAVSPQKKEQLMALGAYACIEKASLMEDVIGMAKDLKAVAKAHPNQAQKNN
jgi:CheY-like chemotaxis protein